ncbi:MAG TPA: hypothetical protein VGM88_12160 [Kofleriaceae bacterium]|jgi:hypothetical protein
MKRWTRKTQALALAVLAVSACGGHAHDDSPAARIGPALGAALGAADHTRAPWRCADEGVPPLPAEERKLGARTWKLAGHEVSADGETDLTIGVVADAGGSAPATLAAIGRLRGALAHADLVVTLGGMGANQAEIEATLGALADQAPFPVVALPGDLEPADAQAKAIAALRAKGVPVVDGRLARRIELPGATIATLPGAGAASRLVAGAEGCGYRPEDVAAAAAALTALPGLRIVAEAEAPRGMHGGDATGDPALVPDAAHPFDLALHGAADAVSPAQSGGRDGKGVALTPGPSDATPRLPGPVRAPTAGMLVVRAGTWSWKPIR